MIGKKARIYCCEDLSFVENYDKAINDNTQIWDIHHKLEIREDGTHVSSKELKEQGLLYNRPACELIFLTKADHSKLHRIGKHHSDESKRKMRESSLGDKNGMYGRKHKDESKQKMRGRKFSDETRQKMQEARKKYWEDKKKSIVIDK